MPTATSLASPSVPRKSPSPSATTCARPKADAHRRRDDVDVTPAQATSDSSSRSPEQASVPLPPAFSCRPASYCANPVSMRTEGSFPQQRSTGAERVLRGFGMFLVAGLDGGLALAQFIGIHRDILTAARPGSRCGMDDAGRAYRIAARQNDRMISHRKRFAVKPLDVTTWPDFARLVEAHDGVWGGCWCMAFHSEGVGRGRTAAQNRSGKECRVAEGRAHAALVYDGAACVGWCQFGPPDELPRIKHRRAYLEGLGVPADWRITCFFVDRKHRGQGVAAAALEGALHEIARLGGGTVESYPEDIDGPVGLGVIPSQRDAVDVRTPGLHANAPARKEPLARHEGRPQIAAGVSLRLTCTALRLPCGDDGAACGARCCFVILIRAD